MYHQPGLAVILAILGTAAVLFAIYIMLWAICRIPRNTTKAVQRLFLRLGKRNNGS